MISKSEQTQKNIPSKACKSILKRASKKARSRRLSATNSTINHKDKVCKDSVKPKDKVTFLQKLNKNRDSKRRRSEGKPRKLFQRNFKKDEQTSVKKLYGLLKKTKKQA